MACCGPKKGMAKAKTVKKAEPKKAK